MATFASRFRDFYFDPLFIPSSGRSLPRLFLDLFPALLFALRGED